MSATVSAEPKVAQVFGSFQYRHTEARKVGGDGLRNWAVFVKGSSEPVAAGLTFNEQLVERRQVEMAERARIAAEAALAKPVAAEPKVPAEQPVTKSAKVERPSDAVLCRVFQATAEAVGGNILQACQDCDEKAEITRDSLIDSLVPYGGEGGRAVYDWCVATKSSTASRFLNAAGVPKTWE